MFHFAVLTLVVLGARSAVRILAATKTLTRLYKYLMRLLVKPPFRFLDLPPEVRNIVYHHHFTLYRTLEYQKQFREMRMLPDAILNVNRLIYKEAAHSLYSDLFIGISIAGRRNVHDNKSPAARVTRVVPKLPHVLRHISTIHLKICGSEFKLCDSFKYGVKYARYFTDLEAKVETVCTSLAALPNLQRVKILFAMESPYPSSNQSPARHRIPGLLRPLKLLRRANPDLVVEMPGYCPISTAELAELQKDYADGSHRRKNMNENLKKGLGNLRAMRGKSRKTDKELRLWRNSGIAQSATRYGVDPYHRVSRPVYFSSQWSMASLTVARLSSLEESLDIDLNMGI